MKRTTICALLFSLTLATPLLTIAENNGKDPQTVKQVDYQRYAGKWNEIAHAPNFFQSTCLYSTAEYTLKSEREFLFVNTCFEAGGKRENHGDAIAPNPAEPGKLELDLKTPSRLHYWIVRLDTEYQWAVVSGPGKKSLHILAREVKLEESFLKELLQDLHEEGFDVASLIFAQRDFDGNDSLKLESGRSCVSAPSLCHLCGNAPAAH